MPFYRTRKQVKQLAKDHVAEIKSQVAELKSPDFATLLVKL